eukprot:TRINITY_DN315_c0_g1_i1.p1 TRINITY_DN315_c0_g1~~TRINITY_DN315_c0_g1_i1.p1  ORF type:complete len:616 (+),score=161.16 TRINITY_DN315_c0_g1_i1:413-2260(+)
MIVNPANVAEYNGSSSRFNNNNNDDSGSSTSDGFVTVTNTTSHIHTHDQSDHSASPTPFNVKTPATFNLDDKTTEPPSTPTDMYKGLSGESGLKYHCVSYSHPESPHSLKLGQTRANELSILQYGNSAELPSHFKPPTIDVPDGERVLGTDFPDLPKTPTSFTGSSRFIQQQNSSKSNNGGSSGATAASINSSSNIKYSSRSSKSHCNSFRSNVGTSRSSHMSENEFQFEISENAIIEDKPLPEASTETPTNMKSKKGNRMRKKKLKKIAPLSSIQATPQGITRTLTGKLKQSRTKSVSSFSHNVKGVTVKTKPTVERYTLGRNPLKHSASDFYVRKHDPAAARSAFRGSRMSRAEQLAKENDQDEIKSLTEMFSTSSRSIRSCVSNQSQSSPKKIRMIEDSRSCRSNDSNRSSIASRSSVEFNPISRMGIEMNSISNDETAHRPVEITSVPPARITPRITPSTQTSFTGSNGILEGKSILVVDDSPVNRLILRRCLSKHGAAITEAVDGLDAVEVWKMIQNDKTMRNVDLIWMDVAMPKMRGTDASKELRRLGCRVAIIACTGNVQDEDRKLCLASGMNILESKPLNVAKAVKLSHFYLMEQQYGDEDSDYDDP